LVTAQPSNSQNAFVQPYREPFIGSHHTKLTKSAVLSCPQGIVTAAWPTRQSWISYLKDSFWAIKTALQILTQRWLNEGKSTAYLIGRWQTPCKRL